MIVKKLLPAMSLLVALFSGSSYAGSEDWDGQFKINFGGQTTEASHTPTRIKFLFLSAGKCIALSKGSNLNGVEIKEDVNLCTSNNITKFTQELQKLGAIVSKQVTPGPTYQE